jgi:DNA polymerase (family 10)
LNEYGLLDKETEENIVSDTEEHVFNELGLDWIPPVLRENTGEITAAANNTLPDTVTVDDIRGDLQMHTTASDGAATLRDMAEKAMEKGYEYIAVTDHGPALGVAGGLTEEEIQEQRDNVEELNQELDIHILHGIEANINKDGELDLPPEQLEQFDIVLAAYHASGKNGTETVCTALEDYPVDILAHPTNRLLLEREGLDLDIDRVIHTAAAHSVAIEINANPKRLDLDWKHVKQHRDTATFAISTDAHSTQNMDFMRYGVYAAEKAWLEPEHVLNTKPLDALQQFLNQ